METTWRDRLRYRIDEFFGRGPIALILGLFAVSLLIILAIAIAVTASGVGGADRSFVDLVWMGLLRTLDPGTMGGDQGRPEFLGAMLTVTLGGIFVVAALIGIINTGIQDRLAELRKGRSRVIEAGHTVILGWNQQVFTILAELVVANENHGGRTVVVLADREKVTMDDEIRARIPNPRGTKIVCRSGSPVDLDEIDIASIQQSRSIIVLAPEVDEPDIEVIKTILAITNDPNRRPEPYHVVAELHDPSNIEAARLVGRDEVELVLVGDVVSRIIAQTCRQAGLSIVYGELLDFDGDEIYFSHQPVLEGRAFGDALSLFEESTLIGICVGGVDVQLNPPPTTIIGPEDRLILIAADDDAIRVRSEPAPAIEDESIIVCIPTPIARETTLMLGWNQRVLQIAREIDAYVAPRSGLTVVSDDPAAAAHVEALRSGLVNQALTFVPKSPTSREVLDSLNVATYQHVLVVSPTDRYDAQRADARTLVTLLHLRDIAQIVGHPFSITSEMADVRNRSLAEVTRADDFIVSDRLISLLITQVAENKQLNAVFADLFDAEGSEVYLRPVGDYVLPGREVAVSTIVEAARRLEEVAIGYRLRAEQNDATKAYGVHVNPRKSERLTFDATDKVIVLARG
ncbi:MAG TPA: potassium transporter TrkA [Candidatus Limnocylindria bacterium]|nr:potassium transporter TrkA [Candidatus Limnocylindria bacterium]